MEGVQIKIDHHKSPPKPKMTYLSNLIEKNLVLAIWPSLRFPRSIILVSLSEADRDTHALKCIMKIVAYSILLS